ncbi:PREDICTED: regulator of G-protein signaling 10 [Gekko japonicus]|uniref:Regulator of G-protein signaling 10 n=1 Tax=Gekko japonicus TaxID=146911 RepID=A0ABM1JLR1_GEKJA|nr:PREDICTED: regulator of G-protein signaling 10 [Gekko japonicus]
MVNKPKDILDSFEEFYNNLYRGNQIQFSVINEYCLLAGSYAKIISLNFLYFSEINDNDSKPSSSNQSLNGTTRWATSLENLLEDPEGIKRFREFLKKEFSEENVLFWLACEEFKKTQDKKQMQKKANEIYMTFLSSKASFQVNVEGQSRLDESILEQPHPLMFQKLQDQIFNLMKYDSYSRFLKSDMFLKLKQTEEQEENSSDAQTAAKRASRIYNT